MLDLCDGAADGVTRLFADLGADVLKIEPPGGADARAELPGVAGASIPFALNSANKRSAVLDPAEPRRPRAVRRVGRNSRHRGGRRQTRGRGGVRHVLRRVVAAAPASCCNVGYRLRRRRPARALGRHRSGVLRIVDCFVAVGTDHRATGAAAGRHRLGDCRGTGRVGRTRRLLPPITLRHRRLHRLLSLRGGGAITRSAVRFRGPGRRRPETDRRAVAWQAAEPADLPDLPVPGRPRPDLPALAAPMARHAVVAGGAPSISGSQVRHDRGTVYRVKRDQHPDRTAVRDADHGGVGDCRAVPWCADRGGAESGRGIGLRALPICRRAHRAHDRPGRRRHGPGGRVRRRRAPRRFSPAGATGGRRRSGLVHNTIHPVTRNGLPPCRGHSKVSEFWTSA